MTWLAYVCSRTGLVLVWFLETFSLLFRSTTRADILSGDQSEPCILLRLVNWCEPVLLWVETRDEETSNLVIHVWYVILKLCFGLPRFLLPCPPSESVGALLFKAKIPVWQVCLILRLSGVLESVNVLGYYCILILCHVIWWYTTGLRGLNHVCYICAGDQVCWL
jgi:hypothetical protein